MPLTLNRHSTLGLKKNANETKRRQRPAINSESKKKRQKERTW